MSDFSSIFRTQRDGYDHFDRIPDSVVLLVLDWIGDVKALGRCSAVSRRFNDLVPKVHNLIVKVDSVNREYSKDHKSSSSAVVKSRGTFSSIFHLKDFCEFLWPHWSGSVLAMALRSDVDSEVERQLLTQVLKNFTEIRCLKIEFPSWEVRPCDGMLWKWKADFGSKLEKCVILSASSVVYPASSKGTSATSVGNDIEIESVTTVSYVRAKGILIAASVRHYQLHPIVAAHSMLESLVSTDADGQGILCMNKGQLEEFRLKSLPASSSLKRTTVPALNVQLWHAANLDLPDGVVLKGATLVVTLPSEEDTCDMSWVDDTFEEPYGTAVRMLKERRTYCRKVLYHLYKASGFIRSKIKYHMKVLRKQARTG